MSVLQITREVEVGRSRSEVGLGQKQEAISKKKTKSKKDWGCGSSGRALGAQAGGPEFKPQYQKKRKKKECREIKEIAKVWFLGPHFSCILILKSHPISDSVSESVLQF
jgi:hypothetical protein